MLKNIPLSLEEIKKIVYNTPGFFTCPDAECTQSIATIDQLRTHVWGDPGNNRFVSANGVKLAYCDEGNGECIFLLHGMRDSKEMLAPFVQRLRSKYRVISIDFRGHGYSEKPADGYSTDLFASDIIALAEALSIPKAIIFGHSLGAAVAIEIAARKSELVSKIILAGVAFREKPGEYRPANPEKMLSDPQAVDMFVNMLNQKFFKHRKVDEKDPLLQIREKAMLSWMMIQPENAKCLLHLRRSPLEGLAAKISIPVLLLIGEKDVVGTIEEAGYIGQIIQHCYTVVIKDAGHYMFLEFLDPAVEAILAFLADDYQKLSRSDAQVPSTPTEPVAEDSVSELRYQNVEEICRDLASVYRVLNQDAQTAELAQSIGDVMIHFEFTDLRSWGSLSIKEKELAFAAGRAGKPNITEHLPSGLFVDILLGNVNAANAGMAGKIKVEGDFHLLMKFQPLLGFIIVEYRKQRGFD